MNVAVFPTSDAAAWLGISPPHASQLLSRLDKAGLLIRLKRGLWALKEKLEPLALPQYLTNPFPSYVSLQTALYRHGLISQIPAVIYAVSIARTNRVTTPLGTISIHHVHPSFFFGFETADAGDFKIATREKALVDFLYLSPARSKLFRSLPELEFPRDFNFREARRIISKIRSSRRRKRVSSLFERLVSAK
jgi:predicted transcriptional regulator of viral defense system